MKIERLGLGDGEIAKDEIETDRTKKKQLDQKKDFRRVLCTFKKPAR